MSERAFDGSFGHESEQKGYIWGYSKAMSKWHGRRRASEWAGFLLPHLRPGMSLLDCGCGVGSITIGLAEIVAPG